MTTANRNVTFRPFEDGDFGMAAELVRQTWCEELGPVAGPLAARQELAGYLKVSTWSMTAWEGNDLLGIMLVADHNKEVEDAARWADEEAFNQRMAQMDPEVARLVDVELGGVREEAEVFASYQATGAPEADVAFKLLVVSKQAQGLGLGKKLFGMAVDAVRADGVPGYHLMTDSNCDVTFYDHLGLTQAMKRPSAVSWPGHEIADGSADAADAESADAAAAPSGEKPLRPQPADDFYVYVYAQRF